MSDLNFETDHYTTLGLASGATLPQIKRAYRRLARQYHPDVSKDYHASERFREIQRAYEVLSNPAQRYAYDQGRRLRGHDRPPPIEMQLTPSHATLRCLNEAQMVYVLVDIRARAKPGSRRAPINLSLVLDQSTSMKGPRLEQVKQAMLRVIDELADSDLLSVVTFNDRAQVVLSGNDLTDRSAAKRPIRGIHASGGTEIYYGLEAGLKELQRHSTPESLDYLVLLTDGHTYGDEQRCLDLAQRAQKRGATLSTLGVGLDWNEELLEGLARLGGGRCHYVESSRQIAATFEEWFHGIGSAYARNMVLHVHLVQGVELRQAYRIAPDIEKLDIAQEAIPLGLLEAARPQCLMLELLVAGFSRGVHRLAGVELGANLLGQPDAQHLAQREIDLDFQDGPLEDMTIPPEVLSALAKLTVYKMQEKVMADLEAGEVTAAVQRLETLATRLLDLGEAALARAALLEAGQVSRTGTLSQAGRKKIRYGTSHLAFVPREVTHDQMP
jgi:Ca-activated chloride channel family protein